MSDKDFPRPGRPRYKVINVHYSGTGGGWKQKLEDELNRAAVDGWRPILYGDAGQAATVIMERIE